MTRLRFSRLRQPGPLLVILVTILGLLFVLVSATPFFLPTSIQNSIVAVQAESGANTTLDLQAGHYYLLWRTDEPQHPVVFHWQVDIQLASTAGQAYLSRTYAWDEEVECKVGARGGPTCSIWTTQEFGQLDLPAGRYTMLITVLNWSSSDGSPHPPAQLHFNEPFLKGSANFPPLVVAIAITAAPSVIWVAASGRRRRRDPIVSAAASSAAVPRVVESADPPPWEVIAGKPPQ